MTVSKRNWRLRLIVPLAGLVGALGLAACGSGDDSTSSDTSASGGGSGNDRLPASGDPDGALRDPGQAAVRAGGGKSSARTATILYQNADQDPTKQQSQVEAMVTQGVDVMVLDPVDSTSAAGHGHPRHSRRTSR